MKFKITNRQFLSAAIIVFYLIPLLFFSSYSIGLMSQNKSWGLLSLGLLLVVCGTLTLILLLYYWEQSLREKKQEDKLLLAASIEKEAKVTALDPSLDFEDPQTNCEEHLVLKAHAQELHGLQSSLQETQEQFHQMRHALELKEMELKKQEGENQQLQLKAQQVAQDFADYKLFSEEQLKQKQLQLNSLQQIIEDQRSEMEKRQEQISQLDTKVHDLSYEIKTLLYLHEEEQSSASSGGSKPSLVLEEEEVSYSIATPLKEAQKFSLETQTIDLNPALEKPIKTAAEASALLKKSIKAAQKLTGANYATSESSRYRDFSSSYYTIDQRRLFDCLRNEERALLIVYSLKESKILFINSHVKVLLGWSPDKFVADFAEILQEDLSDWKGALSQTSKSAEMQTRLLAKTKLGQEVLLNCHLGVIATGIFRNYAIGVLYPA